MFNNLPRKKPNYSHAQMKDLSAWYLCDGGFAGSPEFGSSGADADRPSIYDYSLNKIHGFTNGFDMGFTPYIDKGYALEGRTSLYAFINDRPPVDLNTFNRVPKFTVSFWAIHGSIAGRDYIDITYGASSEEQLQIYTIATHRTVRVRRVVGSSTVWNYQPFTQYWNDDQWVLIQYVESGDSRKLYIDGLEIASDSTLSASFGTNSLNYFRFCDNFQDAAMHDVRFYNRALSESELLELRDDPFGPFKRKKFTYNIGQGIIPSSTIKISSSGRLRITNNIKLKVVQ